MLKIYCQDCGSPTSYTSLKPKFCSSCGKSFDKTVVVNKVQMEKPTFTKPQNIQKQVKSNIDEDYDYDDNEDTDNVDYVPNINKIDIEISDVKPSKVKMRDIISNLPEEAFSSTENIKPSKTKKGKTVPKKNKQKNSEFLNQFKAEAGTLRPSYRKNRKEIDG
jgi:hypothetical protein